MNALEDLEQRIKEKIAVAQRRKRSTQAGGQHQKIAAAKARRFGEIADRLLRDMICPRVERLASHFDNSEVLKPDEIDHRYTCQCRFRATSHFPASACIEVTLNHDEAVKHLLVLYGLQVGPDYVPFQGRVQLAFPIDTVDEDELVRWIDDQLVDFVEAYLCFEDDGVAHNLVVDPVCGMVLIKHHVAAKCDHEGNTYYFCADNCLKKFEAAPESYVSAVQTSPSN